MKNAQRFALVATLALSAVAAQAGQFITSEQYPVPAAPQSTLTRAQVIADFTNAKATGHLPSDQNYANYPENAPAQTSGLTRAEVRNQTLAELKNGGLHYDHY